MQAPEFGSQIAGAKHPPGGVLHCTSSDDWHTPIPSTCSVRKEGVGRFSFFSFLGSYLDASVSSARVAVITGLCSVWDRNTASGEAAANNGLIS